MRSTSLLPTSALLTSPVVVDPHTKTEHVVVAATPRVIMVGVGVGDGDGDGDGLMPTVTREWIQGRALVEDSNPGATADEVWERAEDSGAMILCVVQDGRDAVVERALRKMGTSQRENDLRLPLFARWELVGAITRWTECVGVTDRLIELDRLSGRDRARVMRVRVEDAIADPPDMIRRLGNWLGNEMGHASAMESASRAVPPPPLKPTPPPLALWAQWLTEDDLAVIRQVAGSVLVELGYVKPIARSTGQG